MKTATLVCLFVCLILFVTVTVPAHAASTEYVVQSGDTLTHIARRFGTTIEAIVHANDIADPNLILIGQVLQIPVDIDDEVASLSVFVPRERLLVADFDNCAGTNNLDGAMGAAYQAPGNRLTESYVSVPGRGCVARLEYELGTWGAFWLKLPEAQLASYRDSDGLLVFDIRSEEPLPNGITIELKRLCSPNEGCGELSVYFVTAITTEWQTRTIPLEGFGTTGRAAILSSWDGVEELVFTFEALNAGNNGLVYLDNIRFER